MEKIWFVSTILLLALVISILLYITWYRKNIKSITEQLIDIIGVDTNQLLTAKVLQKDIIILINRLNELLKNNRRDMIAMKSLDKNFKESITNISHDLRTPLTTAGGYMQMLREENLSKQEKTEYLQIVEERQNVVKVLLEQLFEYAKMEAGEISFEIEKIDCSRILVETLALYYDEFAKKNQEPEIKLLGGKCMVLGDANGLKRVFSNIIYNALTHGEHTCNIEGYYENEGYSFSFSNKSELLTEEELENIFERFYTKDKSRNKKTTGLGLYIAKQMLKSMGGSIHGEYEGGILSIVVWLPKII